MDSYILNTTQELEHTGPRNEVSKQLSAEKYFHPGEDFSGMIHRVANALSDDLCHFQRLSGFMGRQEVIHGGRILSAAGSSRKLTANNCFVSPKIYDSLDSIFSVLRLAALTMQQGGGIGYDFSNLRPMYDEIKTQGGMASGPVSFMEVYNSMCGTLAYNGRRGAQMAVLRCDHPDIVHFINSKKDQTSLTNFNISVGVTDPFIKAVKNNLPWDLVFGGRVYKTIMARDLWNLIMDSNWGHAEPGVVFIDRMNEYNNLYYCEEIHSCNPCGEQPLPHNGSCLLGALNVSRFFDWTGTKREFNFDRFSAAIHAFVPSLDNVIDRTGYPLPEQYEEARLKRRMGVGVMGMSTIEVLGHEYGSEDYIEVQSKILETLRNECYRASINRAKTHGAFPMFDRDKFMAGKNVQRLPLSIQDELYEHGIRNGTLTTIAPTGTTSLSIGDNVAGGIEPVFAHHVKRKIRNTDGTYRQVVVTDYMLEKFGVYGTTANEVSAKRHVDVLTAAQRYIDSAISKTINYNGSREDFDEVYMRAYDGGAKGCSTFNINGFRDGILEAAGSACTIDPDTGHKTCS